MLPQFVELFPEVDMGEIPGTLCMIERPDRHRCLYQAKSKDLVPLPSTFLGLDADNSSQCLENSFAGWESGRDFLLCVLSIDTLNFWTKSREMRVSVAAVSGRTLSLKGVPSLG